MRRIDFLTIDNSYLPGFFRFGSMLGISTYGGVQFCRVTSRWLAVFFLQGCAVVTDPGFDYTDPKLRTSVTLGQYVPSDADNPPQGVVTPITPALVQAQF